MNSKSTTKEKSNNNVSTDVGADFASLGLASVLTEAVIAAGYREPTPIQRQAIPVVAAGRDVLGSAQTGTGKTAAFALPILQRLIAPRGASENKPAREDRRTAHPIRTLVLAPTRELAAQIGESFRKYGKGTRIRCEVVFGGVSKFHQVKALRKGVDVLVATPGRLLDLMGDREVNLRSLEILVLDEADRMLDMGFIDDVRRIISVLPAQRQTLLFSATLPPEIQSLANSVLQQPVRVSVEAVASERPQIEDFVYRVSVDRKPALLLELLVDAKMDRVLVFTRTKHGADRVAKNLDRAGVESAVIHGNKSQAARERALADFKRGHVRVIVATDIAARGIDVKGLSHVVNFDIPLDPESYVHRIGRTGRAGESGIALSFCASSERSSLKAIERLLRRSIDRKPMPEGFATQEERSQEDAEETASTKSRAPVRRGQHRKESDRTRSRRDERGSTRYAESRATEPRVRDDEQRPVRTKRSEGTFRKRERSGENTERFEGRRERSRGKSERFDEKPRESSRPRPERFDEGGERFGKRERSSEKREPFWAKSSASTRGTRARFGEEGERGERFAGKREPSRGARFGEKRERFERDGADYTEKRDHSEGKRREGFGARHKRGQSRDEGGFRERNGKEGFRRSERSRSHGSEEGSRGGKDGRAAERDHGARSPSRDAGRAKTSHKQGGHDARRPSRGDARERDQRGFQS